MRRHVHHGARVGVDDLPPVRLPLRVALQPYPPAQMRSAQREANGERRADTNGGVGLNAPAVAENCVACDRKP